MRRFQETLKAVAVRVMADSNNAQASPTLKHTITYDTRQTASRQPETKTKKRTQGVSQLFNIVSVPPASD